MESGTRSKKMTRSSDTKRAVAIFMFVIFTVLVLRNAWVSERAYINFRVVENFLHGYGLGFNPGERVLPVSQPLWPIILAGLDSITLAAINSSVHSQLYFVVLTINIVCSLSTAFLFIRYFGNSIEKLMIGFLPLMLSKAFMDFTTSGLENSFVHLLLVLMMVQFMSHADGDPRGQNPGIIILNATGALVLMVQWELLPIVALILLAAADFGDRKQNIRILIFSAVLPAVLFFLTTTFFYGSPLPNLYVARFHADVGLGRLIRQGIMYLLHTIDFDPVSSALIIFSISAIYLTRQRRFYVWALGMIGSLFLILTVGGDSMGGRMISPLVLVSCLMLAELDVPITAPGKIGLLGIIAVGIFSARSPVTSTISYHYPEPDHRGIIDVRGLNYLETGLLRTNRDSDFPPDSVWAGDDWLHKGYQEIAYLRERNLGFEAYRLGPDIYVLSKTGITDPLMARLPADDRVGWDLDTMERSKPAGYSDAILQNNAGKIGCDALANYFEGLRMILTEEPFARGRIGYLFNLIFSTGTFGVALDCAAA